MVRAVMPNSRASSAMLKMRAVSRGVLLLVEAAEGATGMGVS